MPETRVCIIGGGAIGLSTALHLARRGVTEVTVLEAGHVAGGSSGLSVGIVETQYLDPLDIELRALSMRFFDELERDHCLQITRNGYLRLGHSDEAIGAFERSVEIQSDLGIEGARVLDPEEIGRLIPDMRADDVYGGLFGARDGFLDGHLYCTLLAEMVEELGIRVLARQKVERIEERSTGLRLHTSRDQFDCDVVVNAAGPWANEVSALLGMEPSILPQRHEAVVVHLGRALDYVMPSVMDYTPHSGDTGLYFRHERSGQLIAGLHSEEITEATVDPDSYGRSASPEFLEDVASKIFARLPGIGDAQLAHGWAGLYPVSLDGLPQVGPLAGRSAVIAACGAGGSGIQLSPVIGQLAADWITHGAAKAVTDGTALVPRAGRLAADRA